MKKVLSVFLAVLMLCGCLGTAAFAEETDTAKEGTFSAFCYNVAGLPDFSSVTGDKRTPEENQAVIGKYVNDHGYDIFATQEDFGYHDILVKNIPDYKYATQHHGGIPYGDGTNIFTKDMPMYNENHKVWRSLYGILDDGADEFSQKGVTYCAIEVAKGVIIDFYDLHADAYDDAGSREARADNFVQLAEMINARTVDRPVIITGDFNEYLLESYTTIRKTLVEGLGLKDAWIEIHNNGNYNDATDYLATVNGNPGGKWGRWDSVERFLYKSGGGIEIDCTSFEYINVYDENGNNCSDHAAAAATFTYSVDASAADVDQGDLTTGGKPSWVERVRKFVMFFRALFLVFTNFDAIKEYLGKV